jgi:ribosome maturation factor RimP
MQFSIFLILSLSKDAQAEGQANTFAKEGLRLAAGAKNTIFAKKQVGRRPTFLFDGGQGSAVDTGKIEAMVTPSLEAMGYRLVRVSMTGGRRATLQVMAERLDGAAMTVEDCADISRSLSALLDVADPIVGAYTLEVSSPGIDRPLVRREDFQRFAGFEAKVELNEPVEGRRRFRGRVLGIEGEIVRLLVGEVILELPFDAIARAKLVLTDELVRASQPQSHH